MTATLSSPSGAGPHPNFTDLLDRAGGRYDLITEAMWAEFDARVADWHSRYIKDIPKERRK